MSEVYQILLEVTKLWTKFVIRLSLKQKQLINSNLLQFPFFSFCLCVQVDVAPQFNKEP